MKWSAEPFKDNDLPELGRFFKKLYSGSEPYGSVSTFQWKILDNIFQRGIINLVRANNQIVSVVSATPKRLLANGETMQAAEIGDCFTDPRYFRQGMFGLLDNQTREDAENRGIDFVYGTPNQAALPGHLKVQFKLFGGIDIQSLMFPVNPAPLLQNKIGWALAQLVGLVWSAGVRLLFTMRFGAKPKLNFQTVTDLPSDWPDFWEKAKGNFDFIFDRSSESMNWRYFDSPNKYRFEVVRENGVIVGYYVWRILIEPPRSSIVIADYLFLKGKEGHFIAGVKRVLKESFVLNGTSLNIWCPKQSRYYFLLRRFGFIPRGAVPIIFFPTKKNAHLETSKSWHFTTGDSDNI